MKRVAILGLALLLMALPVSASESVNGLSMEVVRLRTDGKVDVVLHNKSDSAIRLWNDSNSWGADRWRLFCIRGEELRSFYQASNQIFTMNVPTFWELKSGQRLTLTIDLNQEVWKSSAVGAARTFRAGDIVMVAYDVPWSKEASEKRVWSGLTASFSTMR